VAYVPVFSTATRPVPPAMAVVRADLRDAVDGGPVAWALVEVAAGGVTLGQGVSGPSGAVVIVFPYPEPPRLAVPSLPNPSETPAWDVELRVFHAADTAAAARPDLCAVLAQPPARLLSRTTPVEELGPLTLTLGEALIARSADSSTVAVAVV
jgi:hypothetical protein